MPTVNPVTEARGAASKLSKVISALTECSTLPILEPLHEQLIADATKYREVSKAIQQTAANNPQLGEPMEPQYLPPTTPGHVGGAVNPAAVPPISMSEGTPF